MNARCLPARARPPSVCRLCDLALRQPANGRAPLSTSIRPQWAPHKRVVPRIATHTKSTAFATSTVRFREAEVDQNGPSQSVDRIAELRATLAHVEAQMQAIYQSFRVEKEPLILDVLDGLENVAQQAIAIRSRQPLPAKASIRQSSAGALLSGLGNDDVSTGQKKAASPQSGRDALPSPSYISKLAEDFIKHATVFISPNVLCVYIHLQRLLVRPKTIPEALYLYAHKPVPIEGSSPPKFSSPKPNSAKSAVPPDLADEALTAAIEAKDMPLALNIIDHTYCTPAWRRRRMIQKFGLPGCVAAVMPLIIYTIAQEASVYSNFLHPDEYKWYVGAGFTTYVVCTSTIGYVALTTYNDHHDRVVWRPGTPLTERYLREDERAALDRIACSWGFKELWKRGEEEGEEWEGLRQWIMRRSMILDKPDLMPGMNTTPHPRELD